MHLKKEYRTRKTLSEEIADTESRDQHRSICLSVSMTRSLYLHALHAVRDGDYGTLSAYIADLVRRDKHVKYQEPALATQRNGD
jgi:hypothetical protein